MSDAELRTKIMRKVYVMFIMRKLTSPFARVAAFFAIILGLASSVSLPHVIQNALNAHGIPALTNFVLSAMLHTTLSVQLFLFLAAFIVLWSITDLVRKPSHAPQFSM